MDNIASLHEGAIKLFNITINLPIIKAHRDKWVTSKLRRISYARRVWNLQPFGFDLKMLRLHVEVLEKHIHRFVLVESTFCYRSSRRKPLVFAQNSGVFPKHQRRKIVALNADHVRPRCGSSEFSRCFQYEQRNLLLGFARRNIDSADLILCADTDEIARPTILKTIRQTSLFWDDSHPEMLMFAADSYRYGFQCKTVDSWMHGPRIISVRWLKRHNFSRDGFYNTRLRTHYSVASIPKAGWHLSSFGTPREVLRKLKTAGHANLYGKHTVESVAKCMRHCADFVDKHYRHSGTTEDGLYPMRRGSRLVVENTTPILCHVPRNDSDTSEEILYHSFM